ncbi:hypothetical protein [[Flexibacter] sp. ATCC 35208]|uniref:hypothetical protein n=1 Tax=[Flexibacter] sp. ATCC 35208 TaxID=1936242 RepID=UPI0009C8E561|nr:hypothetical protein [[Flexibacter] sp. ATCC 35208]OMP77023.1 hypothetical protein BW716_22250 [[Flexibacter] sp. ATCC 35208]
MMRGNKPENTDFVNKLLTDKEVLIIDQHSTGSKQLYRKGDAVVWVSEMPDTGDLNVALFNLGDNAQEQSVTYADLGIKGSWQAKDLWTGEEQGKTKVMIKQAIQPHGTVLLRLHKK